MENGLSLAELIALSWSCISRLVSLVNIRQEGFAIIKKSWGKPIKVYSLSEHWAWKIPIAETFDKVDIRKQIIYLNAHSIKSMTNFKIPMNTTIDAQAEFRVVNPNVIYHISDDIVRYDENKYTTTESYIDNTVHLLISKMLHQNAKKLTITNIQKYMTNELNSYNKGRPTGFERNFEFDISDALLIEKIVIVSFDNNISLRRTE